MATIRDTDLLYVQRGETPHNWTGAELKSLVSNAAKAGTLTVGQYLTPLSGKYNGTSDLTINVDGTASATPGKVVVRDSNGDFAGNVITANKFVGDGSQLTNAGAVLSDHTGIQRLVTTTLTEGAMVTAATSSALTFNETQLELSINNKVRLRGQSGTGVFDGGVETSGSFESNRSGSLVPGLSIKNEGVEKLVIYNSGRVDTKSTINIATTNSSAINIFPSDTSGTASIILQNNGNAFFTGNVDIGNGNIQLDSNGSATFSGTVTGNLIVGLKTLTSGDYIRGSNYNGQTARTWHVDATSANTASKVVARDSNGNFSAGTITASLNGNASTASNADKLDNLNSTQFIRSDANDSFSGALTGSGTIYTTGTLMGIKGDGGGVALTTNDGQGNANLTFNHVSGVPDQSGSSARIESTVDSTVAEMIFELKDNVTANTAVTLTETLKLTTSAITYKGNTIYHGGNMGSNSGLDADKLDGLHASSFLRSDANDTATGELTLNGRVNIRGNLDISDGQNVDFGSSDDVRINYNSNNWLYIDFRTTGKGIVFRDESADVMVLEDSGIFRPATNNTGSIGTNTLRWGNIYATTFTGALSGNASSSTTSTNSRVDHRTTNAWHRPIFVVDSQSSGANLRLYSDSASTIGINPNTNEIRATKFIGALSGKATDADKLDGLNSTQFLRSDASDTTTGSLTVNGIVITGEVRNRTGQQLILTAGESAGKVTGQTGELVYVNAESGLEVCTPDRSHSNWDEGYTVDKTTIRGEAILIKGNTVWHAGNDGSGSGLDADKVDGLQASSFLRSDANDTATGTLTMNGVVNIRSALDISDSKVLRFGSSDDLTINYNSNNWLYMNFVTGAGIIFQDNGTANMRLEDSGIFRPEATNTGSIGTSTVKWANVYATTFHGAFSGNASSATNATNSRIDHDTGNAWHRPVFVDDGKSSGANTRLKTDSASTIGINPSTNRIRASGFDGKATDADKLDGINSSSFLRSDAADSFSKDISSSGSARLLMKKTDNDVSDHIIFYNTSTRMGEIGCQDTSWLRINQVTDKNIYTPRYIRADNGFYVDGTSKGINGSGNFIGGTIAGASDYGTLLRSNADDTASGNLTFNGRVSIRGHLDLSDGENLDFGSSDDVRINYNSNNWMYFNFRTGAGIIFQDNGTQVMRLEDSGIFRPETNNSGSIGTSSIKWANIYATTFHGAFSGNASSATNATNARIDHDTGNAWHRLVFIDDGKSSATNQRLKTDSASTVAINPSTNRIRASGFDGTATNASKLDNKSRPKNWGGDTYSESTYEKDMDANAAVNRIIGSSAFCSTSTNTPSGSGHLWTVAGGDTTDRGIQFFSQNSNSGTLWMRCLNGKTWHKVWTAGNDGKNSGLDADKLDGLQPSTSASNNTIVQRTSSGYIFANYFNTTPNDVSSGITKICCETGNDGYIRHATAGAVQAFINCKTNSSTDSANVHIRNNSPTVYFRDTDNNSAMIHVNSNLCYILRGGNDTTSWTQVNGQWPLTSNLSNNDLTIGRNIVAVGNVTAYSSDIRLKENFKHIESPLEKVLSLNGYTFDWKSKIKDIGFTPELEKNDIGLIAQEVQEVMPQAVAHAPFDKEWDNTKGCYVSRSGEDYLTVQYERLVPLLVESIKELKAEIEDLKSRINN